MTNKTGQTIAAVMIARNEEANLERTLNALDWVDQIVIADSGSTDKTLDIAKKHNAKTYQYEWKGFGRAKQFVLSKAGTEWVLSIDADEVVTNELKIEIIQAINSASPNIAYFIPRKTWFIDRWIRHSGWTPDYVLRLFKRGKANFNDSMVHEELIADGPTGRLKNCLLHYSYPNLEYYLEKQKRYAELAAMEMFQKGKKAGFLASYLKPAAVFLRHFIFRLGFLDGSAGLQIALLSAKGKRLRYKLLKDLWKKAKC